MGTRVKVVCRFAVGAAALLFVGLGITAGVRGNSLGPSHNFSATRSNTGGSLGAFAGAGSDLKLGPYSEYVEFKAGGVGTCTVVYAARTSGG
jgi:hypothetical protein